MQTSSSCLAARTGPPNDGRETTRVVARGRRNMHLDDVGLYWIPDPATSTTEEVPTNDIPALSA